MRRVLTLLFLLLLPPLTQAGLFDKQPPALGTLNNSADFLPVREAFRLSVTQSSPTQVKLRFIAAPGYYLYRHRFQFTTTTPGVTLGEAQLPRGEQKTDDYFGEVEVYYGVLDVELPVSNPDSRSFGLRVSYQGCADQGLCYPPETEMLTIGDEPPAGEQTQAASTDGEPLLRSVLLFFLAGLGLTFTPCVLPMLPILSGVVLRGQPSTGRSLALSLAYVLPMATGFALLGALMGQFGRPKDAGAYAIMSLESGPFLTMVTLGLAGLSAFPWPTLVGSILPLLIGMILGNLDRDMRAFLSGAAPVMIPFFAFALGTGLDLTKIWQAGLLGLGLGALSIGIARRRQAA